MDLDKVKEESKLRAASLLRELEEAPSPTRKQNILALALKRAASGESTIEEPKVEEKPAPKKKVSRKKKDS